MKSIFYILLLSCIFLNSCNTPSCAGVVFKNGVSLKDGKPYSGTCETYHPNRELKSIQTYSEGLDDGEWVFYFPNGKIQTKGQFNKGVRIGKWEYYYDNGNVWRENHYSQNGLKDKVWVEYDLSGNLISSKEFNGSY